MAAHSSAVTRVHVFVHTPAGWVEAPWDAFADIPYVIAGVEDWTIIVDLHFRLPVLDSDHVVRTDPVIGSILHQQVVAEAIAL